MEWWEVSLRALVFLGTAWSALEGWRKMPAAIVLGTSRYYRQQDGSFRTTWARRARIPNWSLDSRRSSG
jgi:hypothetical protein